MISTKVKKYITFILGLWLLGIAGFCWIALDQHTEKVRLAEHEELFKTRLNKLDKMISGEEDISRLSEAVGDDNWKYEIEKFQRRKDTIRPLVKSVATGFIVVGGLMIIGWGFWKALKTKASSLVQQERSLFSKKGAQNSGVINQPEKLNKKADLEEDKPKLKKGIKGISKIKNQPVTDILSNRSAYDFENINVMYCDEKTANISGKSEDDSESDEKERIFDKIQDDIRNYNEHVNKVDESLKTQSENLEKQVMELKQMAESVKVAATEKPAGEESILTDLAQQITAIREYASQQQNRNERLQEGYDWNIIKNFCLRIIRCIDNIENRIIRLSENEIDTADLEDIRDELIFSLESSGVEQFTPEINSDYTGQEKYAEVIKEKVASNGDGVRGKIAEVIKPGYQYMVDEENIRVVRTARVKLFD